MLNSLRKQIDLLRILRPHQWIKNLVVFFPLVVIRNDQFLVEFFRGAEVFFIFSCAASLVYILNDVLDFQYDHINPSKSHRPIAAKRVSSAQIIFISCLLLTTLAYLLWRAGNVVTVPVAIYLFGNILYSTLVKKMIYIDLVLIAIFFHLRLYTGAQNMQIELSYLYYSLGLVCFLGLAALKRYVEISLSPTGVPGRTYGYAHLKSVSAIGLFCAMTATILLVKFLGSTEIKDVYRHPSILMSLVPFFIGEITLLIRKARTKSLSEDLTMLWLKDIASQIFFIAVLLILFISR